MHHALLLLGSFSSVQQQLPPEVRLPGADVRHLVTSRLTVDDARTLRGEATRRPIAAPHRSFVVAFTGATIEAQNALLKTLEEPAPTSRFFIIVPREEVLIATVRSRLEQFGTAEDTQQGSELATEFLSAPYGKRLETVAARTKEKDDVWIETMLTALERVLSSVHDSNGVRALLLVRSYVGRSGASKKMLLEHLALALPVR